MLLFINYKITKCQMFFRTVARVRPVPCGPIRHWTRITIPNCQCIVTCWRMICTFKATNAIRHVRRHLRSRLKFNVPVCAHSWALHWRNHASGWLNQVMGKRVPSARPCPTQCHSSTGNVTRALRHVVKVVLLNFKCRLFIIFIII